MFDRKKYKSFAKQQLKNRWGVVILVILLTTVVSLLFDIPRMIQSFSDFDFQEYTNLILEEPGSAYRYIMQTVYGSNSYLLTFVQSFVSIILSVAAINVYLKMSRSPEKVSLSVFFEGLNNWWRAILAYLWNFLWVFLWTMLFIIPGIVKSYAYSQIYYIIVEHPGISITKAMKISMIITKGHKADLFVQDLSFIGWYLLGALTFGIGFLWITPYRDMTFINSYHAMLKEALETGKLKPEDLTE